MENLQDNSQLRQNPSFVVLRVNNNGGATIGNGNNAEDFDFAAFEQLQFQGNTINLRGGNGGGGHGLNSVRNHLFHVMLVKLSLAYAQHTSPRIRRLIEFISLAFVSLLFAF
uniref:Uncharacterized protein n=1 Tax=Panagrolaimus sp. ES5 TaxID=591445 RepID=A0AC34G4M2_9BILA